MKIERMFCPTINNYCRENECRDWDSGTSLCWVQKLRVIPPPPLLLAGIEPDPRAERMGQVAEILFRDLVKHLPMDPEEKEAIEKLLEQKADEAADTLIKEIGLGDCM